MSGSMFSVVRQLQATLTGGVGHQRQTWPGFFDAPALLFFRSSDIPPSSIHLKDRCMLHGV